MAALGTRGNPHASKVVTARRAGNIMIGKEGKKTFLVFQLCTRPTSILIAVPSFVAGEGNSGTYW